MNNKKISAIDVGELSTTRLEALTDGIFAIAMTILVLEVHVPELVNSLSGGELWQGLVNLWPKILSFAISFIILGMFWVSHHTEFRYIKKLDNKVIWLNMFYLLFVSLLPFSAALLGSYSKNLIAVIIYGVHLIFMVLVQYFIWYHARSVSSPARNAPADALGHPTANGAHHHKNLMVENLDPRLDHLVKRVAFVAIVAYLIAIALSFINTDITLVFYALVPLPYIFGWIYYLA